MQMSSFTRTWSFLLNGREFLNVNGAQRLLSMQLKSDEEVNPAQFSTDV